jgi:uncharacterized protein (DUF1501 family)
LLGKNKLIIYKYFFQNTFNINKMKRRDFLKKVPIAAATTIIGGSTVQAYANSPMIQALTASLYETDRVLIVIQMSGGNDGLNTIFPLDQYDNLKAVRTNLLMDQSQILKLNDKTGIHPGMKRFKQMHDDFRISVQQIFGCQVLIPTNLYRQVG